MAGSSGIGQLLKGVIMGVVLILAIIGSMSMLEKNKTNDSATNTPQITNTSNTAPSATTNSEIRAPNINIASQTPSETITQEQTATKSTSDNFQPVLEEENGETEAQAETIKYGILKLSTINPENKETLLADYTVFNNKNIKVAENNNTSSASYRLPTGTYRVVTTLVRSSNATTREVAPVQSTKTITISAQKLSNEVFELEPPPTIGVLQVSATNAKNNKAMKADFFIQKENGETVASRQNITNSLFKLKAGSYKVTVKSGNNSDFRTVVVEPGESTTEVFKLQEAFLQGKVLVRIFDNRNNQPLKADIEISTANGKMIQALKAVSQSEISLAAGNYKINVLGSTGESNKNITVVAGQSIQQVFRIDAPLVRDMTTDTNTSGANNSVQLSDDVKISGAAEPKPDTKTVDTNEQANDPIQTGEPIESILKLYARNDIDQKPIKSNFYVQTLNGKHLAKKIYADSAKFNLQPGKYRITVRAKNRKNIIRNIQITANQSITEVFSLQRNIPVSTPINNKQTNTSVSATEKPSNAIPNGFLNVSMQPAKNTHFIISNRNGRKVVELTSVPSGNFKLDTGIYTVTAILNGQRRKQNIQVRQGKTSRLNFNSSDFQKKIVTNNALQKGGLRSKIVDNNGRPLRGNLTVTNLRGQIVARANNVSLGIFDLPAVPHTISVNYQGLSGNERVNIEAGKTTVQTFTITPNNRNPAVPSQQPRDVEDLLKERLKEELQRIF